MEYKYAASETWTKVATIDANVLEYRFEKLKEKSDVMFRISAENAVGLGLSAMSEIVNLHKHASKSQHLNKYINKKISLF